MLIVVACQSQSRLSSRSRRTAVSCVRTAALRCQVGPQTLTTGSTAIRGRHVAASVCKTSGSSTKMSDEHMTVRCYRSHQEAIDEVQRELNVRSRCFPRWIAEGRVSRTDAQDRLDRLASALVIIEALDGLEENAAVADLWLRVETEHKKQAKS